MTNPEAAADAIVDATKELERALSIHPTPFHSAHEGFAVLLEEIYELQAEVFKGGKEQRSVEKMREEAIQCAAMCIRFVADCC